MTQVDVKNVRGEVVGSIDLDERVFGIEPNRAVLHQAVVAQLANARKGTHATKTRGEVAGGTHKMWRQKGTGRARQGDRRAPHWAGGGVVFGPHPRSYQQSLPKKMRRLAMRSALSARVAEHAVMVIDELVIQSPKTREMAGLVRALGVGDGALIVVTERDEQVRRSSANLENIRTVTPGGLNLLDVLNYRHVVLTRSSAETITQLALADVRPGRDRDSRVEPEITETATSSPGAATASTPTARASTARAARVPDSAPTGSADTPSGGSVERVVRPSDTPLVTFGADVNVRGDVPIAGEASGNVDQVMDDVAHESSAPNDVALAEAAEQVAAPDDAEPDVTRPSTGGGI